MMMVAICSLLTLTACQKTQPLATVPTEAEANEIINVLHRHNIETHKEAARQEGGERSSNGGSSNTARWQVLLDRGMFEGNRMSAALQLLEDYGLPRPSEQGLEKAYQEGGLFPSESAQKAQRLKELKTEIEKQLRLLPGVVRANVNLVLPEDNFTHFHPYAATASVLIIRRGSSGSGDNGGGQSVFTDQYVRELVAHGVPTLQPEAVSVVIVAAPLSAERTPQASATEGVDKSLWLVLAIAVLTILTAIAIAFSLRSQRQRHEASASNAIATTAMTSQADREASESLFDDDDEIELEPRDLNAFR